VTRADWFALAFVAITGLLGLRRGLIGSVLSAAAVVAGAILGARLAPHLLDGGDDSSYTPVVALAGAGAGALALQTVAGLAGAAVRRALRLRSLRTLDSLGGLAFGAATGLAIVWILGAVSLHFPGQPELRRGAQRSLVLQRLNGLVPPSRLLQAIERADPFPAIAGPSAPVDPPDPTIGGTPGARRAAASVVRVLGTACGLSVAGSGWAAAPELVVTAAHVVAGQRDTAVDRGEGSRRLAAEAVAFDARNDLAVLRVTGLGATPLRLGEGERGEPVAILGYPGGGGLTSAAGRVGRTVTVLTEDAYGAGPVRRRVTSLRGNVRKGNSGGPAVNARGEVESMVFATSIGSPERGFGVPPELVRRALAEVSTQVSTEECAR